jgi:sec-independent protein translocase protein TatA
MLNSPVDIAILGTIVLLLFGPKKLPEVGKALGQGIGNFKKHLNDAQNEVKSAINTEPEQTAGASLTPASAQAPIKGDDPRNSSG